MNPKLKTLLDLWPQIVAGYHKSWDHYWEFVGELNVLTKETNWFLKHDGYCYREICFGPFDSFFSLVEWDGEDLKLQMLDICRGELLRSEEDCLGADMPVEHWKQLIEKLKNLC